MVSLLLKFGADPTTKDSLLDPRTVSTDPIITLNVKHAVAMTMCGPGYGLTAYGRASKMKSPEAVEMMLRCPASHVLTVLMLTLFISFFACFRLSLLVLVWQTVTSSDQIH